MPTARQQLMNAVLYIAEELSAPDTAASLLDEVDDQVSKLSEFPYRHRIYPLMFAMKHEIRFFPVKNYSVFYVIREEEKTVEIWRFLHQRQQVRF